MSEYIIDVSKATTGLQTVGNRSWLMGAPIKEQIIRCKDCKHYRDHEWILITDVSDVCHFWGDGVKVESNGFCKWGERREVSK